MSALPMATPPRCRGSSDWTSTIPGRISEPMKELALVVVLMAVAGCHKKENAALPPPSPASAPPEADASGANPAAPGPAPVSVAPVQPSKPLPPPPTYVAARADNYLRENVIGEVDGFLTGELQNFVRKNGRLPQSFA